MKKNKNNTIVTEKELMNVGRVLNLMRAYERIKDALDSKAESESAEYKMSNFIAQLSFSACLELTLHSLPDWVIETKPEELPSVIRECLPKIILERWK